jgi:aldose sugar dehydrogenase
VFDGKGGARAVDRWDIGRRVRDLEVAPDGALWLIEDANPGGVFRLTPVGMAVSAPVAQPQEPAGNAAGGDVNTIIRNNNCLSCHRIGPDGGDLAPSLNGIGSRSTEAQIREAIVNPPLTTNAGAKAPMPSYEKTITGEDLKTLVHYLSTLPATP